MKETLKIIKIGSYILDDEVLLKKCLQYFSKIKEKKILIHGGGDFASRLSDKMEISVQKFEGRRITTMEVLEVVTMAYAGKINKSIVTALQYLDCNGIGLSGADGNCIESHKREVAEVDYGFAGDIDNINTDLIESFLNLHLTPIFCAITHDKKGQLLNTNADTIASEIASAFAKKYVVELKYLSKQKGVLKDLEDENSVILNINAQSFRKLKENNIVTEGMLPKIETALKSISNGVHTICIGDISMLSDNKGSYTTIKAIGE